MIAAVLLAAALLTNGEPVRLTVAGDSLALGIGATDSSRGFAFDLFRRVDRARPRSEVTNLAIGGATVADVLRLEVPRIAATEPGVVLLEVGANDAVRRRAPAAFGRDFHALVVAVRRAAPRARLVLFNVPDISVSPIFEAPQKPALHRLADAYNAIVSAEARRSGWPVVDLYAFSQRARGNTSRYLSADQFHPSDDGHAAIASDAWPVLQEVLAR